MLSGSTIQASINTDTGPYITFVINTIVCVTSPDTVAVFNFTMIVYTVWWTLFFTVCSPCTFVASFNVNNCFTIYFQMYVSFQRYHSIYALILSCVFNTIKCLVYYKYFTALYPSMSPISCPLVIERPIKCNHNIKPIDCHLL